MGTRVAIVYGTVSKIIRRVILPVANGQTVEAVSGESVLYIDREEDGYTLDDCRRAMARYLGVNPPDSRCVVVSPQNRVVRIIHADPDLDGFPGHSIIRSSRGIIGGPWPPDPDPPDPTFPSSFIFAIPRSTL